jgi:cysteinylglycine-S-conjugate dipeptidase
MIGTPPGREEARGYADSHFSDFLGSLETLCRIPSVSSDEGVSDSMREAAQAVVEAFRVAGLEGARILEVEGAAPYAYAEWLGAPGAPTLLVYGHYDVQPAGRLDRWLSPPFEPTERGERLCCRGSADDKGGFMMHVAAAASWLKGPGRLPVNIKFLIEGEEEIGSPHFGQLLEKEGGSLAAELLVISDASNFALGVPALTYRYRGACVIDVSVKCLERPVHAGLVGGAVPDAAQILCALVASLTDGLGELRLPYFLERRAALSEEEARSLRELPFDEAEFKREAGMVGGLGLCGSPSISVYERLWARPALTISALEARPMKEALPALVDRASARLVLRTVPDMDSAEAGAALIEWLKDRAPFGVEVEARILASLPWWRGELSGPATEAARRALKAGYGAEAVMMGSGGTIGFVRPFAEALGSPPCLLLGVEDPGCGAHSENEGLHLGDWRKAIASMVHLYDELAGIDH